MRWVAVLTITVLLASVQCLSACAMSSWSAPDPPCHRHHKNPVQTGNLCDHQNAVKVSSSALALAQPAILPFDVMAPAPMEAASTMLPDPTGVESPPGLRAFSILRT